MGNCPTKKNMKKEIIIAVIITIVISFVAFYSISMYKAKKAEMKDEDTGEQSALNEEFETA